MGSLKDYNKLSAQGAGENVPCCICGQAPQPYAVDYNGNFLARCANCRLRFVSPRQGFKTLAEHVYDERYYQRNIPFEKSYKDYEHYFDSLSRWKSPPGLLLDVGAGDGALLEVARRRGWEIEGMEIPAQTERLGRRLHCPVHGGFLEDLKFEARYDVITFIHVFEHTLNPRGFLAKCRSLLKPGGVAYAVFPNTGGLNDRLKSWMSLWRLKSRPWKHLAADHHLWFFTMPTASALCRAIDFPVLSVRSIYSPNKKSPAVGWLLGAIEAAGLGPWMELVLQRPL